MDEFKALTPERVQIVTPTILDLATDPYIRLTELEKQHYFWENGYLVVRGIVPKDICEKVIEIYQKTCKPGELKRREADGELDFAANGYLVREIFFRPEMTNHPYHSLEQACNGAANEKPLTAEVSNFLGPNFSSGTIIYFEATRGTKVHRDIDPNQTRGEFIGAWIALRDISHESARLFVCPGSHKLSVPESIVDLFRRDIAKVPQADLRKNGLQRYSTGAYENAISQFAVGQHLEFRVPIVNAGDVIFFDKKIIHGSLLVPDPRLPRDSIIAFYSR